MNYIENLLILASIFTGFVSAVVGITAGTTCSAVGLKICVITTGIKKYKSIIKKKKEKNDKMVFSARLKLKSIKVLISKDLIDSCISHDRFLLINSVLKEYDEIKEKSEILTKNKCVWWKNNINWIFTELNV